MTSNARPSGAPEGSASGRAAARSQVQQAAAQHASQVPAQPAADEARLVRPYTVTGGRTRSSAASELPMETLVVCSARGQAAWTELQFERADVVRLCVALQSVAEVSARLHLPLGVARVLVGDLHAEGLLDVHRPLSTHKGPDAALLGKVLDGLQAL
jgi:hypothetical protein